MGRVVCDGVVRCGDIKDSEHEPARTRAQELGGCLGEWFCADRIGLGDWLKDWFGNWFKDWLGDWLCGGRFRRGTSTAS